MMKRNLQILCLLYLSAYIVCIYQNNKSVSIHSVRECFGSSSTFLKCVSWTNWNKHKDRWSISFCSWSRECKWSVYNVDPYSWAFYLIASKKKAYKIIIRSFQVNCLASDMRLDLLCFKRAFGTTAVIFPGS